MLDILFAVIIGAVGGFAGGMLGIGGGAIYVPAMVLLLGEQQQMAQGASLAAIVATGIVGGITHLRNRNVDIPTVALVVPAAIPAGFGAALLADALHADTLRRIFAVVMLYLALSMIWGVVRTGRAHLKERESSEHGRPSQRPT